MVIENENPLYLDVKITCQKIVSFIETKLLELNRDGVIIGYSGGLDSTVVANLSVASVGPERVTLLNMPDKDSKDQHRQDAELVATELGAEYAVYELTSLLQEMGIYDLIPFHLLVDERFTKFMESFNQERKKIIPRKNQPDQDLIVKRFNVRPNSLVAKFNAYGAIKHRMRMVLLYHQANIRNLMVVGAANRTELMTGTFIQWGCDHNADVMPLIHLYRVQVEALADYLEIPERIRNKPADPDITPIVGDKGEWLGSFEASDHILWGIENGLSDDELYLRYGEPAVVRIKALFEHSRYMREAPYRLEG
jgi:NAD+ synthase